jgi:transposase
MRSKELTNEQWRKVAPLLPPQKPRGDRPARDHRHTRRIGEGRRRGGACLMADHVDRTVEDVTPMKKETRER